jgi:hypothetical protein
MFNLKLSVRKLPPDEWLDEPSPDEVYAEFALFLQDADKKRVRDFFTIKWDINCLLDWVVENKNAILCEPFPSLGVVGQSLAERISRFYDVVDPGDDAKDDAMYEYRTRHGVRFALRGVDVPVIYIGLNSTGHEISGDGWACRVDMEAFIRDVE